MSNPSREQAIALAKKYLTDTYNHCYQVGKVMEYFAHKLGQDEEQWFVTGLLHDVDRDHTEKDASKHLKDHFDKIVDEVEMSEEMRNDIKSHGYWLTGVEVGDSLIRKYLISIDELSGLLFAYARMRPTGFEGMERSSVNKKIKDKTFAAGVDREHVVNCVKYLEIPLAEFAMDVVEGLKTV